MCLWMIMAMSSIQKTKYYAFGIRFCNVVFWPKIVGWWTTLDHKVGYEVTSFLIKTNSYGL